MRYRIVLSRHIYDELKQALAMPLSAIMATIDGRVYLHVDDSGREIVESRCPGRVNWNAHVVK